MKTGAGEGHGPRCGLEGGPSAWKKLLWSFFSEVGRSPWGGSWAPLGPNSLPCPSSPSPNKRYKNDPPDGGPFFYGCGGRTCSRLRAQTGHGSGAPLALHSLPCPSSPFPIRQIAKHPTEWWGVLLWLRGKDPYRQYRILCPCYMSFHSLCLLRVILLKHIQSHI